MALPVVWDVKHHHTEYKHIYSLVLFYGLIVFITAPLLLKLMTFFKKKDWKLLQASL